MGDTDIANLAGIQWTNATRNFVTGCTRVKKANGRSGCDSCYAFTWHDRLYAQLRKGTRRSAPAQYYKPFSHVQLLPDRLVEALRITKPQRIFADSMGDLFHADVPDWYLQDVFAVFAATPHITWQVLTKRPERMRTWINQYAADDHTRGAILDHAQRPGGPFERLAAQSPQTWARISKRMRQYKVLDTHLVWPLPNVHLGTSAEDQEAADLRIPELLATAAAIRFLSLEPLLGFVDLRAACWQMGKLRPALDVEARQWRAAIGGQPNPVAALDWLIIGGESGKQARPMEIAWAQALIEQGQAAQVAVFMKQMGSVWARAEHARNARGLPDSHGGYPGNWPQPLRVRQWPSEVAQAA